MNRVLITAAGTTTAISVIKSLKKYSNDECYIVTTDVNDEIDIAASLFADCFYRVSYAKENKYIYEILNICLKHEVEFVIPIMDEEVDVLSRNKSLFESKGVYICTSDNSIVNICNDKFLCSDTLRTCKGITPVYLNYRLLNFPMFMKPRFGVGSNDCHKVYNEEGMNNYLRDGCEFIFQEILEGQQFVIDIFNDSAGKNIYSIPRKEITSKNGIGINVQVVHDSNIEKYGKMISETLGIVGVANIEVFIKSDNIYFIEINPRFSAGNIFTTICGINYPELLINMYSGKSLGFFKNWQDKRILRFWEEIVYE